MTEEQYATIIAQLSGNEKEHQSYNRRLSEHDDHLSRLDQTYIILERLTNSVNSLTSGVNELKTAVQAVDKRVADIEKEPADKWKKATWKVIELVLAAIVGAALVYFTK